MLTPETLVLAALAGCAILSLLLPFVAGPVRMKFRSWQAAEPVYMPDEEARLPEAAQLAADDLRWLGFEDRGTWRHEGAASATGWVILLEHPRTRDVAEVIAVTTGRRWAVTVTLRTQFADGTEVATFNSPFVAGFPSPHGVTSAWLPEIRDSTALYRVYTQLRDALGGGLGRVGVGPDPAGFLQERAARSLAAWVEGGYYSLDAVNGVVWPTWKGAVLITWRLLWPIKPLYRAHRRRRTQRLLDQFGIPPDQSPDEPTW